MDHLSLRGAHWEMGFQWGARLAERGRFLLDHVPFPLTAERRAFAAACRPAYARHFPAALAELEGTGLLHTQRTAGRFVTEDTAVIQSAKEDLARSRTREYLESMAQLGYDRQQVKALLEEWKEE